jgi:hypothetical protein
MFVFFRGLIPFQDSTNISLPLSHGIYCETPGHGIFQHQMRYFQEVVHYGVPFMPETKGGMLLFTFQVSLAQKENVRPLPLRSVAWKQADMYIYREQDAFVGFEWNKIFPQLQFDKNLSVSFTNPHYWAYNNTPTFLITMFQELKHHFDWVYVTYLPNGDRLIQPRKWESQVHSICFAAFMENPQEQRRLVFHC